MESVSIALDAAEGHVHLEGSRQRILNQLW